ncbi:hypothetical protein ACRN9C_09990 [Shewanella frigidimarina]|uniref:hypothetical protein n=1 Tax=Shewanella frigidimarina TaxID=56812 RepID=UPI003D799FFE
MAKKIRILCRSAHVYGNHKNMSGFDLHNTRKEKIAPEDQNYNSKLSAENVFFSKGKIVKHEDLQQLISDVSDYQEKSISGLKGGMSKGHVAELNVVKSKTKAKVFKWAESASNPAEKVFFQTLHEKIGVEEINFDSEIEALKSTGKVGRLNDKVKAIKQFPALK